MSRFFFPRSGELGTGPSFASIAVRFLITGAVSLGTIWLSLDRIVAEKVATAIVMPTGLLWLLLLFSGSYAVAIGERRAAMLILLSWTMLSVMGNRFLADRLAVSLERPFLTLNPLEEEPFDVVIVLGGGGTPGGNGRNQGNWACDRLVLAAQLYHRRIATKFLCTGQRITSMDSSGMDPADISEELLTGMGVPNVAIETAGGRNTSEEMAQLGERFADHDLRIGLLTSAWHLPRALKLAERQGLAVYPVPADFRSAPVGNSITPGQVIESMIPSGTVIMSNSVLLKEYLGMLVGR